jgi:SET domain-containing protein
VLSQTESRGWGLIAKEDLAENALVIEYCGEMIDDEECTRRLNETEITGKKVSGTELKVAATHARSQEGMQARYFLFQPAHSCDEGHA